jgi:hypothetical protein
MCARPQYVSMSLCVYFRCATTILPGEPPTLRLPVSDMLSGELSDDAIVTWTRKSMPRAGTVMKRVLLLACHLRKGAVWVMGKPVSWSCAAVVVA